MGIMHKIKSKIIHNNSEPSQLSSNNIERKDEDINYCPNCGAQIDKFSYYCSECGNQIQKNESKNQIDKKLNDKQKEIERNKKVAKSMRESNERNKILREIQKDKKGFSDKREEQNNSNIDKKRKEIKRNMIVAKAMRKSHKENLNKLESNKEHNNISRERKITPSIRIKVFERDNYTCQICGRNNRQDNVKLEVDHKIPVSKGGSDDISNLQTLCFDCNRGKSNKILDNHLRN